MENVVEIGEEHENHVLGRDSVNNRPIDINGDRNIGDGDVEWRACGSGTSKEFIVYITQMSIAIAVLGFAGTMAAIHPNERNQWLNIVSFILGVVFPSPSIGNSKKK